MARSCATRKAPKMSSWVGTALWLCLPAALSAAGCGADATANNSSKGTGAGDGNVAVVGSGEARVAGSVEGHQLVPQSAIFAASPNVARSLFVAIDSQAAYCESLGNGVIEPNQTGLVIGLSQAGNTTDGAPVAPGSYPIAAFGTAAGTNRSVGLFYAGNGACKQSLKKSYGVVTAGSVELTAVTDSRVAGTFSLRVGNDNIAGDFDAAPCSGAVTSLAKQGNLTCGAR
jgi:hypothetical protein